jgi:hypothetical protein
MADYRKKNWVDATVSIEDGKDVKQTEMKKGQGKMSKDQNETNSTKEYRPSGRGFSGPFGAQS